MAERTLPTDYWTTAEVMKGIFEAKVCLAKIHSPDGCEGKIIAAHTIPRSQLRKIATNGHVYAIAATATDLARNEGKLERIPVMWKRSLHVGSNWRILAD